MALGVTVISSTCWRANLNTSCRIVASDCLLQVRVELPRTFPLMSIVKNTREIMCSSLLPNSCESWMHLLSCATHPSTSVSFDFVLARIGFGCTRRERSHRAIHFNATAT
jgi:hypothetical protein